MTSFDDFEVPHVFSTPNMTADSFFIKNNKNHRTASYNPPSLIAKKRHEAISGAGQEMIRYLGKKR